MAPSPRPELEMAAGEPRVSAPTEGAIVISGMCGKFPESPNINTFMEKLYNKEDLVTGDFRRWQLDHPEIPQRTGKVDSFNKFDAQFFGVHYKQAWTMEPMSRMLLENAYGAIFDAGINPRSLKNTKTGVFIGSSFSESEKTWFYEKVQVNGFGITGCSRSMYANRISYWLGTTGPSYCVDSACSSSLMALEHAYRAIRSGICDAAVVGGVNLCLQPYVSLQFRRLGYICMDGKTKVFDKNADGYARAESVGVLFLQRAEDAKRVYTELAHVKTNVDGYQGLSIPKRSAECLQRFLEDFYADVSVLPKQIEFIEAYGAGIAEADGEELEAYDRVFCKSREEPLLVGSVKSNMGHSEPASGMNAVTKICLAYHKGEIAPNLHYSSPRDDVAALRDGRLQIVTEPTRFPGGYTAVSSYSFSGVNVHALFKGHAGRKHLGHLLRDSLPRLVVASGRSEASVKRIFTDVRSRPIDPEQVRLLHNIFESEITGHVFRGYDLFAMKDGKTVSLSHHLDYFPGTKRPVWFVYSGMGSQWSGMGTQLMRIPIFAAAIERCCQALAPKGVDLMKILTDPDPKMYDNILHSFVGIAAVQIGLTDVLFDLGIKPDNIIGHSVGELGCAYADGCFTPEEMILAAYSRGLVSVQTPFIRGSMAAVGRGYQEMKSACPPEIEIACHNGPDSCTISGPADIMKEFVAKLTADGVFAKEVPCSNIAYHSRYIAEAGPNLLKYLKEVIKEPKARSAKWLSTSVPQADWNLESAQYSSAEYHTNNLLSSVLFEETSKQIPANAITVEVAPHGLLQAILRRSLASDCINVPLTKRGHSDNVEFFLAAIGKLYEAGLNPQIANIYPAVQFPVSVDTPMLSHLVEWEHSEDWYAPQFHFPDVNQSGEREFAMSVCDREHQFLNGHVINGQMVFPAAGYLVLVWETLGMIVGRPYTALSVIFDNVRFYTDIPLNDNNTVEFNIMIHKGNGNFEVGAGGNKLATGTITAKKSSLVVQGDLNEPELKEDDIVLLEEDIYSELALKGHNYSGSLRSIHKSNVTAARSEIKWTNNWVTFLDAMMQLEFLGSDWRGVNKPREILKLSINVRKHRKVVDQLPEEGKPVLPCTAHSDSNTRRSGGVEITGLKSYNCPKVEKEAVNVLNYEFIPNYGQNTVDINDAVRTQIEIALNNTVKDSFNVIEIAEENREALESIVKTVFKESPHAKKEHIFKLINEKSLETELNENINAVNNLDLVIASNITIQKPITDKLLKAISPKTFILSREVKIPNEKDLNDKWDVLSAYDHPSGSLILIKKRSTVADGKNDKGTKYMTAKTSDRLAWMRLLQAEWRSSHKLVLVSENDPSGGFLGLFNCLRREPGGEALHLLLIDDYNAPAFRPDLPLYRDQLAKNLVLNVYRNGEWGSYQYSHLEPVSVQSEHVYLSSHRPEDIHSLVWTQGPLTMDSKSKVANEKLVQVYYSAVSEQDVHKISGMNRLDMNTLSKSDSYGMEFSGRTLSGERVMGLTEAGALSSLMQADVDMMWPVPAHWSLEDAATVPLAYASAYYCLYLVTRLSSEKTVLVHGGDEPLGQAAISVCLGAGAKVYTTVDSMVKKQCLLKIFPQLKGSQIGNISDNSFEDTIKSGTKGEGCDIVVNTLTGTKHNVSLRCAGYGCHFVNLSIVDMKENSSLGMFLFQCNRNYSAANITNIFKRENADKKKRIQELIADGIDSGVVRPLTRIVLKAGEPARAFRLASSGRQIGKVVLQLRQEELRPLVTPSRMLLPAYPRFLCSSDGVYIVVCGTAQDRSGLEIADWLIQRGATNVILHSNSFAPTPYKAFRMRNWRRKGVSVYLSADNLQTEAGCKQLLTEAAKHGPVYGLFAAPRATSRALFVNAHPEDFSKDYNDKAMVVMNLDAATRKLCPQLKEFVVMSSAAAGRGVAGSSSGALADSVLERVCEDRARLGLPALALQCEHLVHENQNMASVLEQSQTPLSAIDIVTKSKCKVVLATTTPLLPKFESVIEAVESIMGADLSKVSPEYSLEQLGISRSMLEEIRVSLEREFDIYFTLDKLNSSTLNDLRNTCTQKTDKTVSGLEVFFSYIDPEEFNAAEELVGMATAVSTGTETECQFNKKDKYVILVPSMEGHRHIFPTVAQRLKIKASSCQLGLDHFDETVPEIAARLCKVVSRKMEPGADFSLLGYGFGVAVALEMASILESEGHLGTVFCLDGSPAWFSALLEAQLGSLTERQLQDEVIVHMFRVMSASCGAVGTCDEQIRALRLALAAESDWERKLDECMRRLRGRVQFSFQYQRSLVAMAYARIRQARTYNDTRLRSRPLRSQLVLLKATRLPPTLRAAAERLGAHLGLAAYSTRPVSVRELDCDHAAAPENLHVSDILNSHLADFENFKKLNLCMQYIPETVAKIL